MQVPQDLSCLTQLTRLDLRMNAIVPIPYPGGAWDISTAPRMRVTEQGCRFLLNFPALASIYLTVIEEERAALAGFIASMRRVREGRSVLCLRPRWS